jgi:hypothetical protein
MTERDKILKQAVARLQSIKTIDEYKAASEEIIDFTEKIMKSGIEELKTFLENAPSMTPEEQESMSEKFQDDNYIMGGNVIQLEMERLENLPGAVEYSEIMIKKFQERMGLIAEEFGSLMEKFMDGLMNGFMETMVDTMEAVGGAMGAVIDDGFEEPDSANNEETVTDEDRFYAFDFISDLFECRSLSDLKKLKETLKESLNCYLENTLNDNLFLFSPGTNWDADRERVKRKQKVIDWLIPELEKEFTRIAGETDSPEAVFKIKDEIMESFGPAFEKAKERLALDIAEWKKGGFL